MQAIPKIIPVFISSTALDLQPVREAVEKALQRMREVRFTGMEYFGSRHNSSLPASLEEVDRCQVYIGIIGRRYGSGITEAEYQRARERNLPCFIYFKDGGEQQENQKSQQKLQKLKKSLKSNHLVTGFSKPDQLAALVIADLHRWICDKLLQADFQAALSGQFSLPQLNSLLALLSGPEQVCGPFLRQLSAGLQAAARPLYAPGRPQTSDVIFQAFTQAPHAFSNHILLKDFRQVIAGRTEHFVGREFIFNALDALLQATSDFPSGYILIQGEPGIGKTALAGQLVKTRGYVHHFNIALQNIRSVEAFLNNICAQFIVRYGLDYGTLPDDKTLNSGFLSRLLQEVADKEANKPVVILVDALDEADDSGLPATANRLLLPGELPEGIFFIITTRPRYEFRLSVQNLRSVFIGDQDPGNLTDIRRYIGSFIAQQEPLMLSRLAAWEVNPEEFTQVLIAKSEGNFMYLVHVLRDIRAGVISRDTINHIQKLTKGLREYYQRHWRTMRAQDPDRFRDYYEPVVCMLATAREPVSVLQVVEWTRQRWPHLQAASIRDVLRAWWEFLNEDTSQQPCLPALPYQLPGLSQGRGGPGILPRPDLAVGAGQIAGFPPGVAFRALPPGYSAYRW